MAIYWAVDGKAPLLPLPETAGREPRNSLVKKNVDAERRVGALVLFSLLLLKVKESKKAFPSVICYRLKLLLIVSFLMVVLLDAYIVLLCL
jgi:hypothetical protein